MLISTKGQVTIPQIIREKMGLLPNTEVEFQIVNNQVVLQKVSDSKRRGRSIVDQMRTHGKIRMTTAEIMALKRGDDAENPR